ncbi:MAG TPA: Asp-tRNA(Asn)/Glu-tRNA(Gln) amidotransferase subunit GatB, partial [Dehalococcoidia bacterium]|nr:Asp-tRNA(Asn)/Glu-tRNA(Gln) amidotransferase subunit GatB [Dehalococcoidia bacterium]
EFTRFDRKSYPYPDLMKGYQISQYDSPIGLKGWLNIEVDGEIKRIGITRVHLEEDVAKLTHRTGRDGETYSLVDVNRSGVPLMEIVGEPDLRSPDEARQYLIKLRSILRYLGVSTANMEEGSFRCDANISLLPEGSDKFTAKVEVKNMNSFRAVYHALEYEAQRQRRVFMDGGELFQETRGWDDETGKTVTQRGKEYADDYRYFPEPDLPPLSLSREWVEQVKVKLPELPEAKRDRFMEEYGLPLYNATLLTNTKEMADYHENVTKALVESGKLKDSDTKAAARLASNWNLGEVSRILNEENIDMDYFSEKVSPAQLSELLVLESQSVINTATAKSVFAEMYNTGKSAKEIIDAKGLSQITDSGEIEEAVSQALAANPQAIADFKKGKETALKFLVGQVMRATRGRANPQLVSELLEKKLREE